MVPKGTVSQRTAANCRSTCHISIMADILPSLVSAAGCLGASSVRLEQLAAAAQSKDWQTPRLPPPPLRLSCAPVPSAIQGLDAALAHEAISNAL